MTSAKLGYTVEEIGEGERILTGAIAEKFVRAPNDEMVPLTEGSTCRSSTTAVGSQAHAL